MSDTIMTDVIDDVSEKAGGSLGGKLGALISDFDWKALVKSGITSGIKGVVFTGTTYALAWGLDSLFGLSLGKPGKQQQKQQLLDTLGSIQSEIATIDKNLVVIIGEVQNLGAAMNIDFEKMLSAIDEGNVNSAIGEIKAQWLSFGQMVGLQTGTTTSDTATTTASSDTSLAFAQNVVGSWDIQGKVVAIADGLSGGAETDSEGLLNIWTDTFISEIAKQQTTVPQSYAALEQNFLNLVHWLFLGYGLVINAEIRIAKIPQGDPSSPSEQEAAQQAAEKVGLSYISTVVSPQLSQLTHLFLQCAHRLILSQYQAPNANKSAFVPFVTQAEADGILSRANLVAWLINRETEEGDGTPAPANPGIIVSAYYRPSQLTGGKAPQMQPKGFAASNGKSFKLTSGYANNWFKVVDYADSACSQILDYAASTIAMVDYQWTTPTPVPGTALGGTGPLAGLVPAYYDKTTLAPVPAATDNTVIYGYATDLSGLENLYWNVTTAWKLTQSQGIQYCTFNAGGATTGTTRGASSQLTVTGQYKKNQVLFSSNLLRGGAYAGTGAAQLLVAFAAKGNLASTSFCANAGPVVPMNANLTANFASVTIPGASAQIANPPKNEDKTDSGTSTPVSVTVQTIQTYSVGPNQGLPLAFETNATALQQSWYKDYDGSSGSTTSSANWSVTNVSLAWPQPQVSVS